MGRKHHATDVQQEIGQVGGGGGEGGRYNDDEKLLLVIIRFVVLNWTRTLRELNNPRLAPCSRPYSAPCGSGAPASGSR